MSLDLLNPPLANTYRVSEAPTPATNFGDGPTIDTGADPTGQDLLHIDDAQKDSIDTSVVVDVVVRFELRRRMNLTRTAPVTYEANATDHESQSADNRWVTVDYVDVPLKVFNIPDGSDEMGTDADKELAVANALRNTPSSERYQPLDGHQLAGTGSQLPEYVVPAIGYPTNTFGQNNSISGVVYSLWQPHFDRDFASVAELFDLPLYGPSLLTRLLGQNIAAQSPLLEPTSVAGSVILRPDVDHWHRQMTRTTAGIGCWNTWSMRQGCTRIWRRPITRRMPEF